MGKIVTIIVILIFTSFSCTQNSANNIAPDLPPALLQDLQNNFQNQQQAQVISQQQENPAANAAKNICDEREIYYDQILQRISQDSKMNVIGELPECFALDRKLILKAVLIDPEQFQYAADILQEDQIFVKRLLKVSPEILQYAAPEIRGNKLFMENATYISRNSLQYATWSLLDNKIFMKKMIIIDSHNYKFASSRIKEIAEFAQIAFEDDGLLLQFAPAKIQDDEELVKIAVKSNALAIEFASERLQKNRELQELSAKKTSIKSDAELAKFLQENYVIKSDGKNLKNYITNQAKFFKKQQLISRNYITKWQDYIDYSKRDGKNFAKETRLIAADSRNYHIAWRDDFKKYKSAIAKIDKFFTKHNLPSNVIENLSTTYLWKIKSKPLTLAFNLYSLGDSLDEDLGANFANVTSITAIMQKHEKRWEMTIVEVIMDSEIKVDIAYENGHKKYILWDLYKVDEDDKNPKIIFKVEDALSEYFEVFEEQANGKYKMVFRSQKI